MALDYATPDPRLTRELEQVAKESDRVADTLRGINLMPQKFPVEALQEICISLSNLKNGTAEGSVEPLNFARHVLPLVRRDHFHIEGEEPELNDEDDTYFTREHPLDVAITRLYVAVGTALDEYRSQAQGKYDDHVGAEETLEFGKDGTFADISNKSRDIAQNAEQESKNLAKWAEVGSIHADSLRRQVQDSANIAHSIQSQIRIRPIVARWYESASIALSKLPDVMIKTANKIHVGVDVGQIWMEEWSGFNKRLRHLAYDQIRSLAVALAATGERLKINRRPAIVAVERQRDPQTLDAERRVKEILLSGAKLHPDLAVKAEFLSFHNRDGRIKRHSDLLLLKNLKTLRLSNFSLSPKETKTVGQLTNLTSLSVHINEARDFAALNSLTNLTNLWVFSNKASDLTALGQLTNLTGLSVRAHEASDLTALGQLTNLTSLSVKTNRASNLTALGQLTNLSKLRLQTNGASDLMALGELTKLTSLSVHANEASDLAPLGKLSNLTSLTVQATEASDLTALGQLTNLTSLSVRAGEAIDVTALGQLTNLTNLSLHANKVTDLTALGQLTNVNNLKLNTNIASNFSVLGGLPNLIGLSIQANKVSGFSEMAGLTNLTNLTVNANNVNLEGVHQLKALKQLEISIAKEVDLAPLMRSSSLKKLYLANVTFRNSRLLKAVEIELVGNSREI